MATTKPKDDRNLKEHPSQVLVQFSRTTGPSRRLFGSPVPTTGTTIRLTIHRAVEENSLARKWFYARERMVEVEMSPAQFAELMTTMNIGSGVPGTMIAYGSEVIKRDETAETESEQVRKGFRRDIDHVVKRVREIQATAKTLMEKKTALTKAEKDSLLSGLSALDMAIADNLPFMVDAFQEATDKVVTHAKAEIDSFITGNVVLAGFKALFGGKMPETKLLVEPTEPEAKDAAVR